MLVQNPFFTLSHYNIKFNFYHSDQTQCAFTCLPTLANLASTMMGCHSPVQQEKVNTYSNKFGWCVRKKIMSHKSYVSREWHFCNRNFPFSSLSSFVSPVYLWNATPVKERSALSAGAGQLLRMCQELSTMASRCSWESVRWWTVAGKILMMSFLHLNRLQSVKCRPTYFLVSIESDT